MPAIRRNCTAALAALALASTPLVAQPVAAPGALATFFRAAAAVGTSVTPAQLGWPTAIDGRSAAVVAAFTAVHSVALSLDARAAGASGATRLTGASYEERLPDSTALIRRISELSSQLQQRISAPPDRCMLPLGAPSYLWAPQRVSRRWTGGRGGQVTTLTWEVSERPTSRGVGYSLSIHAGPAGEDDADRWTACPT